MTPDDPSVSLVKYVDTSLAALDKRLDDLKKSNEKGLEVVAANIERSRAESEADHAAVRAALEELRGQIERINIEDARNPTTSEVVNIAQREAKEIAAVTVDAALQERDRDHEKRRTRFGARVALLATVAGAFSGVVGTVIAAFALGGHG